MGCLCRLPSIAILLILLPGAVASQDDPATLHVVPVIEAPTLAAVTERLKSTVVNLSGITTVHPEGRGLEFRRSSRGSGFIISRDGYIVTTNNVVENATDIKVLLLGQEEFGAKIVGRDPYMDLALLKIDATRDLPVASLGDSDTLQVSEEVVAISTIPFGQGYTVTPGTVLAKGPLGGVAYFGYDLIQTDAIKPGSGGGPLFNLKGEVIGISIAIMPRGDSGVARPINMAKEVLPQLRTKGSVAYGWLGLLIQPLTPEMARQFGVRTGEGVVVVELLKGSPAEKGGLKTGDVIVEFNGRPIREMNELGVLIARTPPGSVATLKLIRMGREQVVRLTVGDMKEAP